MEPLTPERRRNLRQRAKYFSDRRFAQAAGRDPSSCFHSYPTKDVLAVLDALEAAELRAETAACILRYHRKQVPASYAFCWPEESTDDEKAQLAGFEAKARRILERRND